MTQTVDRRGYGLVELRSRGDLRFLSSTAATPASLPFGGFPSAGAMLASGDLLLAAQRIYPATGSAGLAVAGVRDANTFDPERALRVQRVDGSLSAVTPLSAFGRLALMAPTVEQGGVLYAPLGAIQLGSTGANINRSVRLLPGSLTSVSARGATIPYGGTVDGLSYLYNGATVELGSVGARTASATWNTAWCLRAARSAWIRAR